jgi:hypothetical protein
MSTKRESDKTTSRVFADDSASTAATTTSPTSSLSEQRHSVDRALDETRDNIRRTIEETRREIPRNTQAINDYQEHTLQATREVADSYIESQKEIIKSLQSTWAPYVENGYKEYWNNWTSPQRAAEIYAKIVSNFADNVVTTTRIANNAIFANIDAYKTFVQHGKDDVKEFSRLATNNARSFENTSREFTKR